MKVALVLALLFATTPIGPRFKRSPQGWLPSCPKGMSLIRHESDVPAPQNAVDLRMGVRRMIVTPACFWGVAPMHSKPTEGDFECVYTAQAVQMPACPAE